MVITVLRRGVISPGIIQSVPLSHFSLNGLNSFLCSRR